MLLAGYLCGFLTIYFLMRKQNMHVRSLALVCYNYLFAAAMLAVGALTAQGGGWTGAARALLQGIYKSPPAMTFRADMDQARSLQEMVIYCIMSAYTLRTAVVLFFRKALNLARRSWRVWRRREVYVLWGRREDAEVLLSDLQKTLRRPAVV